MPTMVVAPPQINTDETLLTTEEVGRILRVDDATVRILIRSGRLSPVLRLGRRYRVPVSSLQNLKAE